MKKLFLSSVALAAMVGGAFAADLPSQKAPPAVAPAPLWKGFYVGLNAGGTWTNSYNIDATTWNIYQPAGSADYTAAALLSGSQSTSGTAGFIGGGQIGYNWQTNFVGREFVVGIEADFQGIAGSSGNGSRWNAAPNAGNSDGLAVSDINPFSLVSNIRGNIQQSWLGTVRGRMGVLATPTILVYGTGGLAYGNYSTQLQSTLFWQNKSVTNADFIQTGNVNYSNTLVGWTAGGGAEWMFLQNMSAKVEYLYYDLGAVNATSVNSFYGIGAAYGRNGLESVTNYSSRLNGNIIRAGVNYHFNSASAPVVAKY
jgi:outer membrane immunogenic protein